MRPSFSLAVHHLAAIVLAGLALVAIHPYFVKWGILDHGEDAPASMLSWPLDGQQDNYMDEPYLAAMLHRTLVEGSSLVLFGSSELTTENQPTKVTVFFKDEMHVPLLAIGHDGNQCLSIHAQLLAADAPLRDAKLVLLLSPGWFSGRSAKRGTALEAFLEYQPSPSFYRIRRRYLAGDTLVRPYLQFLADHRTELTDAQPIVQLLLRNADARERFAYWFSTPWVRYQVEATEANMLAEPEIPGQARPWQMGHYTAEQWKACYQRAVAAHLAQCTNNNYFINDAFYTEYVHGETREVEVVPLDRNREYKDLISLLDFLKAEDAKPLFIIQSLNPYVYTNVKDLSPTMEAVRRAVQERGFTVFDQWVDDTAHFQPGILTDVMHLGPLGWARVDSAITTYFP